MRTDDLQPDVRAFDFIRSLLTKAAGAGDAGAAEHSRVCAITQEVPEDPVRSPRGTLYDRSAIEQWLEMSGTSPSSRLRMGPDDLVPDMGVTAASAELEAIHRLVSAKRQREE